MKIEGVTAAWNRPAGEAQAALVLAHGAGGDLNDELLRAVAKRLTERGVATLRFNFPYREAGRRTPGSQAQSEDCYRAVAEHARQEAPRLYCGGKSYGGRMATHIAAAGAAMDGLVLLSYPLHPPGRPERLRDAHLKDIRVPILVVQGTRDPFATPDLLRTTLRKLTGVTLVEIEGGDHSLRVKGAERGKLVGDVADAIGDFVGSR